MLTIEPPEQVREATLADRQISAVPRRCCQRAAAGSSGGESRGAQSFKLKLRSEIPWRHTLEVIRNFAKNWSEPLNPPPREERRDRTGQCPRPDRKVPATLRRASAPAGPANRTGPPAGTRGAQKPERSRRVTDRPGPARTGQALNARNCSRASSTRSSTAPRSRPAGRPELQSRATGQRSP